MLLIKLTGNESLRDLQVERESMKIERTNAAPHSIRWDNCTETISAIDDMIIERMNAGTVAN